MKPLHVLLPAKMSSTRIPRKNLRTVGGRRLLDLAIDRFRTWFPRATIWVGTEDHSAAMIAVGRGCLIYPLTPADLDDRRNVSELFSAWLADRSPHDRCCCHQVSSPFTFRSELQRAIDDPRPYCRSAWTGTIHPAGPTSRWSPLSQQLAPSAILTGNFGVAWGRHVVTPADESSQLSPVSWLSAIDVNTPEDLQLADRIASRMSLADFDDLPKASAAA